jgi:hypothetical protein
MKTKKHQFITLQIDSREPVEFISTTVSQAAIVLQQPSEYSTGQEFSHLTGEIHRVSVNQFHRQRLSYNSRQNPDAITG